MRKIVRAPEPPPLDEAARLYVTSYLLMRLLIGVLGIALPVILLLGDLLVLKGSPGARGSLSAYYHSGMRDFFVAALCITGVFLITYRVASHPPTNWFTTIAGTAAIGVALLPTIGPPGYTPTPLQERFDPETIRALHFVCAAVFILSLALISVRFGREAHASDRKNGRTTFWPHYHFACAATIVLACCYIGLTKAFGVGDTRSLLYGETAAVLAFGASWLAQGLALDALLLHRRKEIDLRDSVEKIAEQRVAG